MECIINLEKLGDMSVLLMIGSPKLARFSQFKHFVILYFYIFIFKLQAKSFLILLKLKILY